MSQVRLPPMAQELSSIPGTAATTSNGNSRMQAAVISGSSVARAASAWMWSALPLPTAHRSRSGDAMAAPTSSSSGSPTAVTSISNPATATNVLGLWAHPPPMARYSNNAPAAPATPSSGRANSECIGSDPVFCCKRFRRQNALLAPSPAKGRDGAPG